MASDPVPRAALTTLPQGTRLGSYEVLGSLATGGMAELFLARKSGQGGFEKVVALKRILPTLALDADFVQMFLDEARIAAELSHPNIAQVYDIGQDAGSYFFTMEYVAGQDLRHVMRAARSVGGLPLEQALYVVHEVAAGLHHAHEKIGADGERLGIVHRDVSPANVILTYEGGVKVVDFGVAKARTQSKETQVGTLKGKVAYMSPEQCMGEGVDARSDVYALGVVLYELTAGARPYHAKSDYELIIQVASGKVPAPSQRRPGYPADLEAVVMKALAREPDQRWQSAEELGLAVAEVARARGLAPSAVALRKYMRLLFGEAAATPLPGARPLAAQRPEPGAAGSQPSKSGQSGRDADSGAVGGRLAVGSNSGPIPLPLPPPPVRLIEVDSEPEPPPVEVVVELSEPAPVAELVMMASGPAALAEALEPDDVLLPRAPRPLWRRAWVLPALAAAGGALVLAVILLAIGWRAGGQPGQAEPATIAAPETVAAPVPQPVPVPVPEPSPAAPPPVAVDDEVDTAITISTAPIPSDDAKPKKRRSTTKKRWDPDSPFLPR